MSDACCLATDASAPQAARALERIALHVNPGGWTVQRERPISTLLGSCVAVCLYDPDLRLAGMNHFLLPRQASGAFATEDVVLNGDYAMEVLVNAMLGHGARKSRIVAKAFGGGNVVSAIRTAIGERNSAFAREWLEREGIPMVASDFGGAWSRKIVFDPSSGDAFCRRQPINQPAVQALLGAEQRLESALAQRLPKDKKVELF